MDSTTSDFVASSIATTLPIKSDELLSYSRSKGDRSAAP